jgi:hypothetical protein
MPISPEFAASNKAQTGRLRELAKRLTPKMLTLRLPNGWTVAGALGHIAFWDRQRLCLMRRWANGVNAHTNYDGELFNEVLQPVLELIPPEQVAAFAIRCADEVDAFLLEVPDEVVAMALARPDKPNLDRGSHRAYHLDQIEKALGGLQ